MLHLNFRTPALMAATSASETGIHANRSANRCEVDAANPGQQHPGTDWEYSAPAPRSSNRASARHRSPGQGRMGKPGRLGQGSGGFRDCGRGGTPGIAGGKTLAGCDQRKYRYSVCHVRAPPRAFRLPCACRRMSPPNGSGYSPPTGRTLSGRTRPMAPMEPS